MYSNLHQIDFIIEKNRAAFCVMQQNFIKPFNTTQIINPFLNSIISTNHENGRIFSQWRNPYTPYFLSSVKSLFLNTTHTLTSPIQYDIMGFQLTNQTQRKFHPTVFLRIQHENRASISNQMGVSLQ